MERYINSFATENDIKIALQNGELLKPYVAYIEDVDRIDWNSKAKTDNKNNYLTFKISSPGTINWTAADSALTKTIEYKLNNGEWVSITSNTGSSAPTITVSSGDKIQFKGNNAQYDTNSSRYNSFGGSALFKVEGNIMSLIYGDNFKNNSTISSDYTFTGLFKQCTNLVSAKNLVLPATTLASYCYRSMFDGCTSLTTAPALPATTLADTCYGNMFSNCTSLTTAPKLPATTLATQCYYQMFSNCTSLTTAPELPATTLADGCYNSMFYGCTLLTAAPELPATTLAKYCYQNMFNGCTSLTTAPELPATALKDYCYYYMFSDCTKLTTAPELPASTLANSCYLGMFYGCTSLTTAPALPATTLADTCYGNMFNGCTSLNYIKCLATDISATDCTQGWVDGVASTGTFVKNLHMEKWTTGSSGIPSGWAVEDNQEPLTFNILSDGTINWTASNTTITKTIDYKVNDNEWVSITSNTGSSAPTINVVEGDKIQFKGNNTQYATGISAYNSFSGSTASFEVEGNIMSLIYGDNFKNNSTISSTYTFTGLFKNCTKLVSAEYLILPSTTLANTCYDSMFNGCTSLTTAPELPATTLADGCYYNMFQGCTSLTTAPELPATTLADSCYSNMFNGCTNLNYIKCLATDISASYCTDSWVDGVASTGTFVKPSSMTSWTTGVSGIPNGWTVEEYIDYNKEPLTFKITSPGTINWTATNSSLTKTIDYKINNGEWTSITSTMEGVKITVNSGDKVQFRGNNEQYASDYSKYNSFSGSTASFELEGNIMSLIYGDDFKNNSTISSGYTFVGLFDDCTGLTSAKNLVLLATALTLYCYNAMFRNCTSLTAAPKLPASTLASTCYGNMFAKCTSLTTAPELPVTTLAQGCYSNMFLGCSSLTSAPVLPATTLATWCYSGMFTNCTSLNYIKCLATDKSARFATLNWVNGVASTGTFVKNPDMTSWGTGSDGIPTGWTVQDA